MKLFNLDKFCILIILSFIFLNMNNSSKAERYANIGGLNLKIPNDIGYEADRGEHSKQEHLLLIFPIHYFSLYNPFYGRSPIPILISVNTDQEPYSTQTDAAEIDHLNKFYIEKKLPNHDEGVYTVYQDLRMGKIYISNTQEYPHLFNCNIKGVSTPETKKLYCTVDDKLFNNKIINNKHFIINYQINEDEIDQSKNISLEIKSVLLKMITE